MQRELPKRINASLPAFTDDDKTAFLNFIASKYKSFDIDEICFEPYRNAVVDAPTFYENATAKEKSTPRRRLNRRRNKRLDAVLRAIFSRKFERFTKRLYPPRDAFSELPRRNLW